MAPARTWRQFLRRASYTSSSSTQPIRLMGALLFEVSPNDPATIAGVAALIMVVAAVASLVPAVPATRVDPVVALRGE